MDGVELSTVRQELEEFACNMHRWADDRICCMQRANGNYGNGKSTANSIPFPWRWKFNFRIISRFILVRSCSIASKHQTMFHRNAPCHIRFSLQSFNLSKNSVCTRVAPLSIPFHIERGFVAGTLISFRGRKRQTWRLKTSKNIFEMHEKAEMQLERIRTLSHLATSAVSRWKHFWNGFSTVSIAPKSKLSQYLLNVVIFVCDFWRRWPK